jgi:hypothetical protein
MGGLVYAIVIGLILAACLILGLLAALLAITRSSSQPPQKFIRFDATTRSSTVIDIAGMHPDFPTTVNPLVSRWSPLLGLPWLSATIAFLGFFTDDLEKLFFGGVLGWILTVPVTYLLLDRGLRLPAKIFYPVSIATAVFVTQRWWPGLG